MADPVDQYVSALVGKANPTQNAKPYWPDQNDLAMSKKYDATYGSPHAPYAQPDSAYVRTTPMDQVPAWYRGGATMPPADKIFGNLNTQADADVARAQHIAAERSAMAKLGWDPGLAITSKGRNAVVNGLYQPKSDVTWSAEGLPSTAMHESMHRSFEKLGQAGKLPKDVDRRNEELYVRALMQRAYGPVELKHEYQTIGKGFAPDEQAPGYRQQVQGRRMMNDPLIDQLEAAAAQEIARKHPGGPR